MMLTNCAGHFFIAVVMFLLVEVQVRDLMDISIYFLDGFMKRRKHMPDLLVIIACLLAHLPLYCVNQQWTELTLTREIPEQQSVKSLKNEMVSDARLQSIEKVSGISVYAYQSSIETEVTGLQSKWHSSFQKMVNARSDGKIIDENARFTQGDIDGRPCLTLDYKALVAIQDAAGANGLKVEASADKPMYQIGDRVSFMVEASSNGCIYLFSIQQDGTAAMIFPNRFTKDNRIEAGERRVIPNETEEASFAYKIITSEFEPPPYSEMFLCVLTETEIAALHEFPDFEYSLTLPSVNKVLVAGKKPFAQDTMGYIVIDKR